VVDILPKKYELYLGVVSLLSFGESLDSLNGRNPSARQDVAAIFEVVPAVAFAPILRFLPIESIQSGLQGLERLKIFSPSISRPNVPAPTAKPTLAQIENFYTISQQPSTQKPVPKWIAES
jgi:hypothetical protein